LYYVNSKSYFSDHLCEAITCIMWTIKPALVTTSVKQ
jgi:hypothetical protein